jgi:hypothetical protein
MYRTMYADLSEGETWRPLTDSCLFASVPGTFRAGLSHAAATRLRP